MASIVDPKVDTETEAGNSASNRQSKREACIELLNQWLADESGYDEENWPKVKQAIAENHTSNRSPFDE
jgi:hypothetical protein